MNSNSLNIFILNYDFFFTTNKISFNIKKSLQMCNYIVLNKINHRKAKLNKL